MLRASGAQRAFGGQVHQNVAAATLQTAAGPEADRLARGRLQSGRPGGRSRRTADEQHHPENNRYVSRTGVRVRTHSSRRNPPPILRET